MARVAPRVPEMTDVLCEACGYVLNGLPDGGRCPECGKPISESAGANRVPPEWERMPDESTGTAGGFVRTTLQIILHPTEFYRTFNVRGSTESARRFARVHWWIAAVLFGIAAATHCIWYWSLNRSGWSLHEAERYVSIFAVAAIVLTLASYFALDSITRLAAMLTNWEATYRGIRLPYEAVLRGMYYHAAHYVPVALAAAVTVLGYQVILAMHILNLASTSTYTGYLYVLSAQVVLSAIYLFNTYWIGMRNMMYANR